MWSLPPSEITFGTSQPFLLPRPCHRFQWYRYWTEQRVYLNILPQLHRLVVCSHGWTDSGNMKPTFKRSSVLLLLLIPYSTSIRTPVRLKELSHQELEMKEGFRWFGYQTLLGEMMHAYVTCRPDIRHEITTMSKFSSTPSALHYAYLKNIARFLRATKCWNICYKRSKH